MKRVLLALALLGLVASANADPADLAGGVLITHTPAGHIFSPGGDYCLDYAQYGIASCEEQNTNMVSGGTTQHMFFYVVAAFAEDKVWCGTQFGIGDVTGSDNFFYFVAGGDANICLPNALSTTSGAGFPMENEGIAIVATDTPWAGNFLPIYWAECYSYYAGGDYEVPLGFYPGDPPLAIFGNCDVPSIIWDIDCLGVMGIGAVAGAACCPDIPVFGACCFEDGSCLDLTEYECLSTGGTEWHMDIPCDQFECPQPPEEGACCIESGECFFIFMDACAAIGGEFLGEGITCEPDNPCPPPVVACCFEDYSCLELTADDCVAQGGVPEDYPSVCDPNPCEEPTPASEDTWGSIKALYR